MRERGEGPVHVVANVLRRGVSTTTGRGVECARYALHECHTHELLSSIANVLGDPHCFHAAIVRSVHNGRSGGVGDDNIKEQFRGVVVEILPNHIRLALGDIGPVSSHVHFFT